MNVIRRTTWAIALALIGCAGCGSNTRAARDITLAADPSYSEPVVILAEIEKISDTVDDANPPYHRVTKSTFLTRPAGVFILKTVPTSVTGFFWSYWGERQRWTIFSPGRAAVTIYPDDGYWDVNGPSPAYARLAVTHDVIELAPDGPYLQEDYDPESKQVTLRLPSYAVPTIAPVTQPSSINEQSSLSFGLTFTSLFGQQVRAVQAALASAGPKALDRPSRLLLVRAIEVERDALLAAGVLSREDQSIVELVLQELAKSSVT